ncbi:MAG: stage II sporulation protein D, partial [Oscillospiraceae bacterium]
WQIFGVSLVLLLFLFALPLLWLAPKIGEGEEEITRIERLPPGAMDSSATIRVKLGDTVTEMPMNTYLQGVVRAEMPASFAQEALCAQAVAARTYTLYKITTGGNHPDADICGDHTCCQAYLSADAAAKNWGKNAENNEAKIDNAVAATDGETALYDGAPILAVFHSSSAGKTRSSGEVWVSDLPYLRAVDSPEAGEAIPNYYSRAEFTADEFKTLFLKKHPEADLTGDMTGWLQAPVEAGGIVDTVTVGGVTVRGTELRSILSLRSAAFETEVQGKKLVFFVTGYGHGVGMSQYGANQMAADGATWREIITHYYTGVTIRPYTTEVLPVKQGA